MINNLFNTDLPGTLVLHVALLVATDMELVLVTARVYALLAGMVQIACQIAPPHKITCIRFNAYKIFINLLTTLTSLAR